MADRIILADSSAKLHRGIEHLNAFKTVLNDLMTSEDPPIDVRAHAEPIDWDPIPGHTLFAGVAWVESMPEMTTEQGMLLGEGLHDVRSALDYIAWHLVTRVAKTRLKAREAEHVAFPMARKIATFDKEVYRRWLPGVSNELVAIAERYQPYHRNRRGRAMRSLNRLSNTDKHRVILPRFIVPTEARLRLETENCEPLAIQWLQVGRALKPQAHFVRMIGYCDKGTEPKMKVKGNLTLQPRFPDRSQVIETLNDIAMFAMDALVEFEAALRGVHLSDLPVIVTSSPRCVPCPCSYFQ